MKIQHKLLSVILTCLLIAGIVRPAMAAENTGYSDVAADAWYADAVIWCKENGIMGGTAETQFSPDMALSRAMLATVLYRAEGSPTVNGTPTYSDTAANQYYANAVVWAADRGLMGGYGNGLFGTNDPVTREQLATILWRYAGSPSSEESITFADEGDISSYAVSAAGWASANHIIDSMEGNRFAPKSDAIRAQVAVSLYRYLSDETGSDESSGNILVAYFSRTGENYSVGTINEGNTAVIAKIIAEQTSGDLFEIVPVTPYPDSYQEMLTVARREADENARPQISGTVANMADYDTVFIGYPIWNADMPMIVYNFLESYDFTGKTVIPFNTHEGSGQAGTQRKIESLLADAAVLDGLAIRGSTAQNDRAEAESAVRSWLDRLDISVAEPSVSSTAANEFDLESGTVLLNSGYTMPILGIGTYTLSQSEAENSVYWALRDGYRLIDTARIYGNEEGVGRGIQRAIDEGLVTREEIFVTTKMWTADYNDGASAIDASLRRLGLDYIDLMILHHSQPSNDVAAYRAMERAVEAGKLRSIGLSNYYTPEDFDRLVEATTITPALLQNETHPYHQSAVMKEHLTQYGTVMESWFPLGGRGHTQALFNDATIAGIAAAHGKTSAQIILRWHLQAGNIAIPGSSNQAHIQENYEIFDFALSDAEMRQMTNLDKNERFASY